MRRFPHAATAFVSGWMHLRRLRRQRRVDRGFVLSDHVDWPGLAGAIAATGARRVAVTHGYTEPVVRWLREERGLEAWTLPTRFAGEAGAEEGEAEAIDLGGTGEVGGVGSEGGDERAGGAAAVERP
jgi:putative mRNA 3-end processing factor